MARRNGDSANRPGKSSGISRPDPYKTMADSGVWGERFDAEKARKFAKLLERMTVDNDAVADLLIAADADASDGSDTSDASIGSTLEGVPANISKNDSEPERLEHWAATLSTTADIPDWTALSADQLHAIRKVKHTGLWLNKTATELNRRGITV